MRDSGRRFLEAISSRGSDRRFRVRVARRQDLEGISALDVSEYKDHSVDELGLTVWFNRYPYGAFVLEPKVDGRTQHEIIGSLGIWPVTARTFLELTGGRLRETEIRADDVMANQRGAHFKYWYVGSVTIEKDFRQKGLFNNAKGLSSEAYVYLLRRGIREWLDFNRFDEEVEVCAIQVGDVGGKLAESYGFKKVKSDDGKFIVTPDGDFVYRLTISRADLENYYTQHIRQHSVRLFWAVLRANVVRWSAIGSAAFIAIFSITYFWGARIDAAVAIPWRPLLYLIVVLFALCFFVTDKIWRIGLVTAALIPLLGLLLVKVLGL